MPKVASDAGDISDVSEVAHDDPMPLPHTDRTPANGATEESGSEEEGDEDQFQVEAIRSHTDVKGKPVKYEIKWVGYPESENTHEPVENLLPDARDILSAYHEKIGFDPSVKLKASKSQTNLKRAASGSQSSRKKTKTEDDVEPDESWRPPVKDWEPFVHEVTHIEQKQSGGYTVFIHWKNGKKTKVSMEQIYKHCPRPMLKFYERHLKFTHAEEPGVDD